MKKPRGKAKAPRGAPSRKRRKPKAIVVKAAAPLVRTDAEWATFVDDVVDRANRQIRVAGLHYEGVADLLFRELFGADVDAALEPEIRGTEAFDRVLERAGASLRMYPGELVMYVRIGAMNQHRRDGAWLDADWSKKILLVALLSLPLGRELIKEGIALAGQPNFGVRHLRKWVQSKVTKAVGSRGRPRKEVFSLTSGARLAEAGVQLKSEKQRRAFLRQLATVRPEKRQELVRDLRDALDGLAALVGELESMAD